MMEHSVNRRDSYSESNDPHQESAIKCGYVRYLVGFLASVGYFAALMTRTCMNVVIVAIVNMTSQTVNETVSSDCPSPLNISLSTSSQKVEFNWDSKTQSLVLSMFFYGYVITQFPSGYLIKYFGSCLTFGLTVCLSGILCIFCPLLAKWDVRILMACRFLMGFVQGLICPSNHAMLGKWAPPLERTRMIVLTTAGYGLGSFVGMGMTGYLCDSDWLGSWSSPFYIYGGFSCLWFCVWMVVARSSPEEHRFITPHERHYIVQTIDAGQDCEVSTSIPWKGILTSRPIYVLLVYSLLNGIGSYALLICTPVYLKDVLNFDIGQSGLYAALPNLSIFLTSLLTGPLADLIISKCWLSVTATRKAFTFVSGFFCALFLIGVICARCDHVLVVTFLTISAAMIGLSVAGPQASILDISSEHAGTILGLMNPFNDFGRFIAPPVVAMLTEDEPSYHNWQRVFFMSAGSAFFAALCYLMFGSSEKQSWSTGPPAVDCSMDDEYRPLLTSGEDKQSSYSSVK